MRPRPEETGLEELLVGYGSAVAVRGDEWQGEFDGVVIVDGVAGDRRWNGVVTLVHDADHGDSDTLRKVMSVLDITV